MEGFINIQQSIPKTKDEKTFRICTFNVHMFIDYQNKENIDNIFDDIDKLDCDVIFLEETMFFNKSTKTKFYDFALSRYKCMKVCNERYGINTILSKHKIDGVKIIPLGKGSVGKINRYATSCFVNIGTKRFQIVGCHLDVYDETEVSRCKQMEIILKHIQLDNSIILGDLNALRKDDYTYTQWEKIKQIDKDRNVTSQTQLTSLIENNNFIDSFKMAHIDPPTISTWSDRRVDYIYINKNSNIDNVSSHVYKTLSSDHYPIYIDISVTNK